MTLSSAWYALVITFFCLLISYPLALTLRNAKHKDILLLLVILPTWINLLLKTYAFIGILSHDGLLNKILSIFHVPSTELLFTSTAFIIVSVYIYIPFMLLPIFNSMDEIPENLLQASRDLGANSFTTFKKCNRAFNIRRCENGYSNYIYTRIIIIYDYTFNRG